MLWGLKIPAANDAAGTTSQAAVPPCFPGMGLSFSAQLPLAKGDHRRAISIITETRTRELVGADVRDGHAVAALVIFAGLEAFDVLQVFQGLADDLAQLTGAFAVDDAHEGHTRQ